MTSIDLDTSVVRKTTAVTAEIDGQLVALDTENGSCYGLNRVATRIWELIEKPATARTVAAVLLGEYAVDAEVCRLQTIDLLVDLQREGLLETRVAAK